MYDAALQLSASDWQIYYGKALCYATLRNHEEAIKCAKQALQFHKHELMLDPLYNRGIDTSCSPRSIR